MTLAHPSKPKNQVPEGHVPTTPPPRSSLTGDQDVDRVDLSPGRPAREPVGVLPFLGVADAQAVVPVALLAVGHPA